MQESCAVSLRFRGGMTEAIFELYRAIATVEGRYVTANLYPMPLTFRSSRAVDFERYLRIL